MNGLGKKMSLKRVLGLEHFPIGEDEIARKLREARKNRQQEVVFSSENKVVRIKLGFVNPRGVPNDYWDHYMT